MVSGHLVLVPVGKADRRVVSALRHAQQLPADELRALHVAQSAEEVESLGLDWMQLGLHWLPLEVVDADEREVGEVVRDHALAALTEGYERVTVVISELVFAPRWLRFLHDRTGRRIARKLVGVAGVSAAMVPCYVSPQR